MSLTGFNKNEAFPGVNRHLAEEQRFAAQCREADGKAAHKATLRRELLLVNRQAEILARRFAWAFQSVARIGLTSIEIKEEMRFVGLCVGNRPWRNRIVRYSNEFGVVKVSVEGFFL